MDFEWDAAKAAENVRRHQISFDEAASVFGDPLAVTFPDPDHSAAEERLITFGLSVSGRLPVVWHTARPPRIRIINARPMIRRESKIYEED